MHEVLVAIMYCFMCGNVLCDVHAAELQAVKENLTDEMQR